MRVTASACRGTLRYAQNLLEERTQDKLMAYLITDTCIKDELCVEVCPTDCIHPKKDEPQFETATQLYIDPVGCIDCGACIPACTSDSIFAAEDVPEDKKEFLEKNAAYYAN
jgi:ferredoxin